MTLAESESTTNSAIVAKFTRYLNGPAGAPVLDSLEEGESFLLQTSDCTLRISKRSGKAIVEPA